MNRSTRPIIFLQVMLTLLLQAKMTEMGEALRSCMEQLVAAREEREQIIVEAANAISSEKMRVRELQLKLDDATRKASKLAAENSSLCRAADSKDVLIGELRASEAAARDRLAGAAAELQSARKQADSLEYEVRMLQKEVEVRGQEREYDQRAVDAARRQQAEHVARIAQLEAECQRLRAMVRKRLPGPAAIAKMRDEVEQPPPHGPGGSPSPRRPGSRSSPRSATPALSPRRSDAESCAFKLRVVEEENRALKQALALAESELQLARTKLADELCKLAGVQRQLKETAEENRQLSDANCRSRSWASALISELEQFRSVNKNADAGSPVAPEKNGNDPAMNGSVFNGHPGKCQDVWELVMQKHEATGEKIETILEQVSLSLALDQRDVCAKREDSEVLIDRSEIEKMVRNMVEKITSMIGIFSEEKDERSGTGLHNKSELCARLQYLVHVCHDLLNGKANLEKFIDEVCLTLNYIVTQCCSNRDPSDDTTENGNNFDGVQSVSKVNTEDQQHIQSTNPAAGLGVQAEPQVETIQSPESKIMVGHQDKLDAELTQVLLDQTINYLPGRKSTNCVIESLADDAIVEDWAGQQENRLSTGVNPQYLHFFQHNSDILAAADKLAECQQTITILTKQLQALTTPVTSGPQDGMICNPRPSSATSDYKHQSLASILAEETVIAEASGFSATLNQVQPQLQKQDGELHVHGNADEKKWALAVVPEPRQGEASPDPKKKKKSRSLLSRIMFRKKVEGRS